MQIRNNIKLQHLCCVIRSELTPLLLQDRQHGHCVVLHNVANMANVFIPKLVQPLPLLRPN